MNQISNFFLSPNLSQIGAEEAPAIVAISAHEKQTIACIPLLLSPPTKIRTIRDVVDVIFNHEFLRFLVVLCWLIFSGFVETFMAQLSDMRYHAGPVISKVSKERIKKKKKVTTEKNTYTTSSTP